MLFSYKYVPHKMEKMQEFIDFIFYEVWCKAPIGLEFSPTLFEADSDLKGIISSFGFAAKAPKRGKKFYKDVKSVYELFALLSPQQIDQFKRWYQANNNIEKICTNDPAVQIACYADIEDNHPELSQKLGELFKGLYDNDLLKLAALRDKIGQIHEHYQAFMEVNTSSKCPFCGISDMQGVYHSTREAYDHYFPKGLYPFNSINFHNLVPACHHCNSSYKTSKDPAFTPKDPAGTTRRRKVFYPFANPGHSIEVMIDLNKSDIDHLVPDDVQLSFGPPAINEEIEAWKDVYGIEERFKAKCCSADAKDWLEQIRILQDAHGIEPDASLNNLHQQTVKSPFANNNFLKTAFLDGCERIGIFNAFQPDT